MALAVGTVAPAFEGELDDGSRFRLGDLRGKQALVLFFYPRDYSAGCTREACTFRDRYEDIQQRGAFLLGVSADSRERHAGFRARHDLPFPLIADPERAIVRLYGASRAFGLRTARVTYVIDREGVIRATIHRELLWGGHVPLAIAALDAIEAAATG